MDNNGGKICGNLHSLRGNCGGKRKGASALAADSKRGRRWTVDELGRVQRAGGKTREPLKNKGWRGTWYPAEMLQISGKRKTLYVLYKYIVGAAAALIDGAACSAYP